MASKAVFRDVQAVLSVFKPKDRVAQEALGLTTRKQAEVFWTVLKCVGENTGLLLPGLAQAVVDDGKFHQGTINGMRVKNLIARKNGDKDWSLTDQAVMKIRQLTNGKAPTTEKRAEPQADAAAGAATVAAFAGRNSDLHAKYAMLNSISLAEIVVYVNQRIDKVDGQIAEIRKKAEAEITAMERERQEAQVVLNQFTGKVK